MTLYSPSFNVAQFELRGRANPFLSTQQLTAVSEATQRVSSQLDWVAQLLGWNGTSYWSSLVSSADEKRQLLAGSFGVYNSFTYPEIVEIRNWENSVVVSTNHPIKENQLAYVGDNSYNIASIAPEGSNLVLSFESLTDTFLQDLSNGEQLRVPIKTALPKPFYRPDVGASGDASFLCDVVQNSIILYPEHDKGKTTPYVYNTFFAGSRYWFDKPVSFKISEDTYINPYYDFPSQRWFIDVPGNFESTTTGLAGVLEYKGGSLVVGIKNWHDPSDWYDEKTLSGFQGVWSNKGGALPFHFVFDSLSLHGFDPVKSIYTPPIQSEIAFDTLLNFVYQQNTEISPLPPPVKAPSQVWWNSHTGSFSIYLDKVVNCGPWVECNYPDGLIQGQIPDYVFPDVASFRDFTEVIPDGSIVRIINSSGLAATDNIQGLVQTLTQPLETVFFQSSVVSGWVPLEFIAENENQFDLDANRIPSLTKVVISNANGLSSSGTNYTVENLKIEVEGQYTVSLMKSSSQGTWFLSPPSELKYIGNTRLFESSTNYDNPVAGEMVWDYSQDNPNSRSASIFYYNRWEYNTLLEKWEPKGDWVNINSQSSSDSPPEAIDFGVVLVYVNGNLLSAGDTDVSEDYQFSYSVNETEGNFIFNYVPKSYNGLINKPKITISDSLTASYVFDISNFVFSGIKLFATPNVEDSETLLRLWKSKPLFCTDGIETTEQLRFPNGLVADQNSGPSDSNWERYFVRLPPSYGRDGTEWQKVNQICQNFGYWGSPLLPENMSCPPKEEVPLIYEETFDSRENFHSNSYIYSEPYLYSSVKGEFGESGEYGNSAIYPSFDNPYDFFSEGEVITYDPLHERRVDVSSPAGQGFGDWEGSYFRADECSPLSGHLITDIERETLENIAAPVWDSSLYKLPQTCVLDEESGTVDANHYKIGYAFFCADLSASEEAVFDLG